MLELTEIRTVHRTVFVRPALTEIRTECRGTLRVEVRGESGLFGPNSVTWKVHAHPVLLVGGLRALMIQALHPLAMAGVAQYSDFRSDPLRRLRGTARYVHAVTFGDTTTAQEAADRVKRIHLAVHGTDPVTGQRFAASDPELLLWVHCVEVHSFLAGVRAYGYRLSGDEQDRYLAEQVAAAELIGIRRDRVPDSRIGYREYFADMLPRLCTGARSEERRVGKECRARWWG